MDNQSPSLSPATQAVLDALTALGQGNVHEMAERSGKARSTTDKAIKTLTDAGLIVAVDTGADPADGTPTRWRPATPPAGTEPQPEDQTGPTDAALNPDDGDDIDSTNDGSTAETDHGSRTDHDPAAEDSSGDTSPQTTDPAEKPADEPDRDGHDECTSTNNAPSVQPSRPGDRKVMAIKGILADHDDGATLDVIVAESGIGHPTAARLLTAMEQADAARRRPGLPQRWVAGPTKASEVDPNPQPPRCPLCYQVIRGLANTPSATATVLPLIRPDGTLHVVGPDGETHVVALPTRTTGITRSAGRRSDVTINADGSQPFGRGELEKLTLDILAANPGKAMTPQDIATEIGGQLGRTVSSGAVRNNCTKAAAASRIVMVSDAPLTFAYPTHADAGSTEQGDNATEQP
ncbi:helix-turn-helix domain-containing protein [Micromonospora sp. NPDC006431]|uniref:helix-turn-helix domain-containing protein n=1 Tax=Micromonospora sp. NPDC006431 TaxID=3364235 RepID=UPI0036BEEE77